MLTNDIFMKNPFVNYAVTDLYPMARLWNLRHKEPYNVTQCDYIGPFTFVCKQSSEF